MNIDTPLGKVCCECYWTNTELLNLGEPSAPRWVCLNCCKLSIERRAHALRDQFAAAALTGMLSYGTWPAVHCDQYARWAYNFADAMLARRTQPTADAPAPAPTAP